MDYTAYLSPFSWRYGSKEMRTIWSEDNKRRIWRRIWVAQATAQAELGLVTLEQVADLQAHASEINISRALEIETETRHDVMAEVRVFAEQCPVGGGIIHLGMTSMDVVDNTDALRVRQSLDLVIKNLAALLQEIADLIEQWAETPVMAFTHLQPAEPSTLGYRLAQYGQDFLMDWENLSRMHAAIKGKGLKGAVGSSASYVELFGPDVLPTFERRLSELLGLEFFPVTTQVYPRKQDYDVLTALAGFGASVHKFAFDLRILQSPPYGELGEPFGKKQVGSSAMPFKRNPVRAESANSLARLLAQMPRVAWDNAALSLLERTLDDSANRRTSLPEAFLITDELLSIVTWICEDLRIDTGAMARNLAVYGPFAATERVLMGLSKAGADRQEAHEHLRQHALAAWEALRQGGNNPLRDQIAADPFFLGYLPAQELHRLMDAEDHVGDTPVRAKNFAHQIRKALEPSAL